MKTVPLRRSGGATSTATLLARMHTGSPCHRLTETGTEAPQTDGDRGDHDVTADRPALRSRRYIDND